ncbi:MAG: gamma-glutamyltransferase family protein [Pseudomonadota bacterium]
MMTFDDRGKYTSARSTSFGSAAVATSEPLAAAAGLKMLEDGGNAIDAAIAAAATLTITEPTSNGIGSDAFALVWDGTTLHGLNASGRAPAGWTPDRFSGRHMPTRGWDTITIPGAVSAWQALAERFATKPLSTLLAPAAHHAEAGFMVGEVTAASWQKQAEVVPRGDGFAQTFLIDGKAPRAGTRMANPRAAKALRLIGETGGAAFYEGPIAHDIVTASQAAGGAHAMVDFAAHTADFVKPLSVDACGLTVHEIPPNGQGLAALIALGILERFDLGDAPDDVRAVHLQIEAVKLSLADATTHVADPSAMAVPPKAFLDTDYLAARAKLIDPQKAGLFATGHPLTGGTVMLCTADSAGRMVAYIQSNYEGFGSGCVSPEFGISLQNRGAAFSLDPQSPNRVGPGKRPFHTIIPGFATRGDAAMMAFGVMGGPIQAQGHTQLVTRIARFGQSVQTAIDAPRFRVLPGGGVALERHADDALVEGLEALGHTVVREAPNVAFGFGGAQAIVRHNGGYAAGSDPRKDGMALVL